MKTPIAILIAVSLVLGAAVAPAMAAHEGDLQGGCPKGFHDHKWPHDGDDGHVHKHKHVGNDMDQNGDFHVCVKHVDKDGDIHVHIDNNVPLDE